MPALSRRALLAGLLASSVAGPTLLRPTSAQAADAATRLALAELEIGLLADHDRVLGLLPAGSTRTWVRTRRRMHQAHLTALADLGPVPQPTSTPGRATTPSETLSPTPSTDTATVATPTPSPTMTQTPQELLRWLAERERRAHVRMRALALASSDLATARVAALTGACERTHRVWDLAEQPSRDWAPSQADENLVLALDLALAHHHAALWTLGRLGPRLSGGDNTRARLLHSEHTLWRNRTRAAIRSTGSVPTGPAPSYLLPSFTPTPEAARGILRDMERSGSAAWLAVFAVATQAGDAATRRAAFQALGDSAVRAARMGNAEAFPGFGDRLQPRT